MPPCLEIWTSIHLYFVISLIPELIQKNIEIIYNILNMGSLIQVDGGSILGTLGKSAQVASEKIIKNKDTLLFH